MQGTVAFERKSRHRLNPNRSREAKPVQVLESLLELSILLPEEWEALSDAEANDILGSDNLPRMLEELTAKGLLTEYQSRLIEAGKDFGLIFGNYRVLERLGAGGMGIVFKAEHVDLRRTVALKVISSSSADDPYAVRRFMAEMRAVAQLQHPNIVAAMDAGRWPGPDPDGTDLRYFVMEYVAGHDLDEHIHEYGPLSVTEACDHGYQIASALAEADKHRMVHRDIKPSNIRITPEGQAKLLDFGLARHLRARITQPGTILGTMEYMAPEQASDAGSVDIRADLYGLGGTLFWCLTGKVPFAAGGSLTEEIARRLTQPAPSIRSVRPDLPAELDNVIRTMMALRPADRYPTPQAVMHALLPFLKADLREYSVISAPASLRSEKSPSSVPQLQSPKRMHRVLIVDDEPLIRLFIKAVLQSDRIHCDDAENGRKALEMVKANPYDLVILDIDMPEMSGTEVCKRLREEPPCEHLKIIMCSGRASSDDMAQMMQTGADDYLAKPLSASRLQARTSAALRLKESQDRSDALNLHLLAVNAELEKNLHAKCSDLVHARNALVLALAELVGLRDTEHGAHLTRIQRYCRRLAEEAAGLPSLSNRIDTAFIEMLECCAPLHDIGKAGLPDHILLKPGKLTPDERTQMQAHTSLGADTLQRISKKNGFAGAFLQMAADIARYHHERFDGQGYPDGLRGDEIPLSARIVALADVYDALRSRRAYKPALSHTVAVRMITKELDGQFDPAILAAFERCAEDFEQIFSETPNEAH
jgi:response regulator RpfG family c-di-GMP phosphodiesterase